MNKLGLLIAGFGILAVLLLAGAIVGIRSFLDDETTAGPTPTVEPTTIEEKLIDGVDSDNDGLVDDLEPIYRTNAQNPDTDGDGTLDGEEIAVLRDPIIPGPDDALDILSGNDIDTTTYTGRYIALLPAGITQQEVLDSDRLEAFIEQERKPVLPTIDLTNITTSSEEGKEAIEIYLSEISSSHNTALAPISSDDIATAFRAAYAQGQSEQLTAITQKLENNVTILRSVSVPEEALSLHEIFLAASEALASNVKLLQNMQADFVGGLIGAKNIEELGTIFQDVAGQISALEAKYDLE